MTSVSASRANLVELQLNGRGSGICVRVAATWWQRAIGLLATSQLDHPSGLWIEPCASVHTMGMRHDLDLVFVDRQGRVLKVAHGVRPWRASSCRSARATLELRAGLARHLGITPGTTLTYRVLV